MKKKRNIRITNSRKKNQQNWNVQKLEQWNKTKKTRTLSQWAGGRMNELKWMKKKTHTTSYDVLAFRSYCVRHPHQIMHIWACIRPLYSDISFSVHDLHRWIQANYYYWWCFSFFFVSLSSSFKQKKTHILLFFHFHLCARFHWFIFLLPVVYLSKIYNCSERIRRWI